MASIMTVASMSLSALAAEDNAVYTLIGEDGNEIVYTQADLDAGHWNVDALGSESPYVYTAFPMNVDKFVNDYGELQLELRYLKTIGDSDSATVTLTDMDTEEDVFTTQNLGGMIYTNALKMDTDYILTLSETFDGETTEYTQVVSPYYAEAEMPEYVTSAVYDSDCTILVGNVEDLRNSDEIMAQDENADPKRFEKVSAKDFNAYRMNLPANAVYKIYTIDEQANRYTGFISTYENSGTPLVYMPEIKVCSLDRYYEPQTHATTPTITASGVKNAAKTDISMFRDYTVAFNKSNESYKVYKFKVPDEEYMTKHMQQYGSLDDEDITNYLLRMQIHVDDYAAIQIWRASSETSTPVHKSDYDVVRNKTLNFSLDNFGLSYGDYMYIVLYFTEASQGYGTISVMPYNFYPAADVSGSAYDAYNNSASLEVMSPAKQFTLYDGRDVDTFFVKYNSSTQQSYRALLSCEDHSCVMEISHQLSSYGILSPELNPDNVKTVQANASGYLNFNASSSRQNFVRIYSTDNTDRYPCNYSLRYYKR